jgi:uncharacterized protein YndB with AHSA1/START domain
VIRKSGVVVSFALMILCAPASAQDTSPLITEGVVEAPVDAVWAAWTTNDGLKSWLAPHASIDLRIGGLMRTNYNAAGVLGDAQTIENTILSFEPERMLSIKVTKVPEGFPFPTAVQDMWTVMYFEPDGESQTRVRVVSLGFGADEESQQMRAYFERGNAYTIEQLRAALSAADRGANVIVIQSYEAGLAAVRSANPDVKLSLEHDPALPDESVLSVEYPAATGNPAGRDVWCDSETTNWTPGRAISFQVKPDHAIRLSVSFLDRNRVAYTSWTELQGAVWQTVRIAFDEIRPNPYFQPPGANTDAQLDVSDVTRIGFAPQDQGSGRLMISRIVVVD